MRCDRDKNKDKQESKRKVRPVGETKKKARFADEDDDDGGKWETVPKRGTHGQMTMQVCTCMLDGVFVRVHAGGSRGIR